MNISEPFSIGGGKTAMYHRANADGSISPVVDQLLFPDIKEMVDKIHQMGLRAGWCVSQSYGFCCDLL
jgi:hypothetical protein